MDINQISIYLTSNNAHALANLVSQILERDFAVSEEENDEISIEVGACTLKILSSVEQEQKLLPIDFKLDSMEQLSQIEQKVQFYNFCQKLDRPVIYQKINDSRAKVLDHDGRTWNFSI